jgi:hypothetical protein
MKISYQCSNCGAHEQTSAWVGIPEGMFNLGYRAHGDVLYCPDCVESWKERNGAEYDEQYNDAQHLFAVWWNRQVQMQNCVDIPPGNDSVRASTGFQRDGGDKTERRRTAPNGDEGAES